MPQQDFEASKLDHAEEILDVVFPPRYQPPEVVGPGEHPLDQPSAAVAAQDSVILRAPSIAPIGRNHFDVVFAAKFGVEGVAVVRLVANHPLRQLVEKAACQRRLHQLAFGRRGAIHVRGDRQSAAVGDQHDFAALAAASRADRKAPFFALLNVASMKLSARSRSPRSRIRFAKRRNTFCSRPSRTHCWKRRWQVWYGGYRSGISLQRDPLPNTHNT